MSTACLNDNVISVHLILKLIRRTQHITKEYADEHTNNLIACHTGFLKGMTGSVHMM
jgi:hypothetical protein